MKKKRLQQKPELTLIPGSILKDKDVLKVLYEKLTGKKITDAEVEAAKKKYASGDSPESWK